MQGKRNIITWRGKRVCHKDACRMEGVDYRCFISRLERGWTVEQALLGNSPHPETKSITAFGKSQTVAEWAKELGLKKSTIHARYEKGLRGEELLTPLQHDKLRIDGKDLTAVALEHGISPHTTEYAKFRYRIKAGYTIEQALTIPNWEKRDSLTKMSKRMGMSHGALSKRLKQGMTLEEATSFGSHERNHRLVTINGVRKSVMAWCREYGIENYNSVLRRMREDGCSFDEAINRQYLPANVQRRLGIANETRWSDERRRELASLGLIV